MVFNGSLTTSKGHSLNKNLQIGPNLLPPLDGVILKWRWHRFVFSTDIEKMYRQILMQPEDRDLQRILWRNAAGEELTEFQLTPSPTGQRAHRFSPYGRCGNWRTTRRTTSQRARRSLSAMFMWTTL